MPDTIKNNKGLEWNNLKKALWLPTLFTCVMWLSFGIFFYFGIDNSAFGIYPQRITSLHGILTSPFAHADLSHLFSNTAPLLFLSTALFYFYKQFAYRAFLLIWLISGTLLWIGGRQSFHIGASGLVYGLCFFMFAVGLFSRNKKLYPISLIVIFLYGSMIWGMIPQDNNISWEGHLFGALIGFSLAWYYGTRVKKPQETDINNWDISSSKYNSFQYHYDQPEDEPE
jgi:membrane associated rhomboid family serine protease